MMYFWVVSMHVISVVAWFAGLFYLGRLFVYVREASEKPEPDRRILLAQLQVMTRRLFWGITQPAMISTVLFGGWLISITGAMKQPWFHLKLLMILGLISYHFGCWLVVNRVQKGEELQWRSLEFRLFNEVPTLFLLAIVSLVYFKNQWISAGIPFYLVGMLVLIGGVTYALHRIRNR